MIAIWRLGGKLSRRVEMALKAAAEYLESGQGKLVTQKKQPHATSHYWTR